MEETLKNAISTDEKIRKRAVKIIDTAFLLHKRALIAIWPFAEPYKIVTHNPHLETGIVRLLIRSAWFLVLLFFMNTYLNISDLKIVLITLLALYALKALLYFIIGKILLKKGNMQLQELQSKYTPIRSQYREKLMFENKIDEHGCYREKNGFTLFVKMDQNSGDAELCGTLNDEFGQFTIYSLGSDLYKYMKKEKMDNEITVASIVFNEKYKVISQNSINRLKTMTYMNPVMQMEYIRNFDVINEVCDGALHILGSKVNIKLKNQFVLEPMYKSLNFYKEPIMDCFVSIDEVINNYKKVITQLPKINFMLRREENEF